MEPSPHNGSRHRFGQFEADLLEGKLYDRDRQVRLESQPFQILAALLERPGEVVSREELHARLWPNGTYVDFDDGLNTAISKLRTVLRDPKGNPVFVERIPRRGYRFLAPVSIVRDSNGGSGNTGQPVSLSTPVQAPEAPSLLEASTARNSHQQNGNSSLSRRGLVAVLVVVVLIAVAGWATHQWRARPSQRPNRDAIEFRKLPDTGNVDAVAISPDGRFVIYARRTGEKVSLRMRQIESSGDVEVLPPEQVNFVGLTFSPDGNYLYFVRSHSADPGLKDLFVMPALGGPSRKLRSDIDSPVSFSPDGHQLVFTVGYPMKNQIEVRIAKPDGTGDHLLTTMEESYAGYQPGATWSPDGRTIAVPVAHNGKRLDSALYGISIPDGSQRKLYSIDGKVGRPLWDPDESGLMVPIYDEAIGRGQLWKISLPSGARERITNDLGNYSMSPDLTADGKNVAVVEGNGVSNIWASSSGYSSKLEQITFGQLSMFGAAETNDGKLLFLGDGEIWIMDATGTARASFAKLRAFSVGICGAYVVADVLQDGLMHIVRLNGDGTHEVILATGTLYSPMCSAGGKFVFYYDLSLPQKILSIPIEGGTPVEIAKIPGDGLISEEEISSDGKMLAYIYERYTPVPAMFLDVISSASGSLLKSFTAPPGANGSMRWSSGDTALDYVLTRNGVDNLWQQNLAGGAPKQVTKFTSGRIFGFSWSKNHKRLLLARGSVTTDVVLLSHLR